MSDELQKLLENAGVNEAPDTGRIQKENIEKVVKLVAATAHVMDKADRPGVNNPSKSNISVYINFILEQVIDDLRMQGYEVNWDEKEWDNY